MNGLIAHGLVRNESGQVLILKRNKWGADGKLNAEPEKWDFPGGTVEKGELPQAATIREVFEETGLKVTVDKILFECSNYDERKDKVFTTLVYLCTLLGEENVRINEKEHSAYQWINREELKKKPKDELVRYIVPSIERCY